MSRKKRLVIEKITKFNHILDINNFILCVVYDEIVDKNLFENLSIKFVILQTKKICQFLFDLEIVNNSKNARNKVININKNRSITLNVQTLITRMKIRFSFNLKNVFSITRRKVFKKRLKNKLFKNKKSFEDLNQLFRFEIKEHEIFFESRNKMIQEDKIFVNTSLFILIVVKILQKTNHLAQQQRIKLFNTQIMKRLDNNVFSNVNRNNQFSQKTIIDGNFDKKE